MINTITMKRHSHSQMRLAEDDDDDDDHGNDDFNTIIAIIVIVMTTMMMDISRGMCRSRGMSISVSNHSAKYLC